MPCPNQFLYKHVLNQLKIKLYYMSTNGTLSLVNEKKRKQRECQGCSSYQWIFNQPRGERKRNGSQKFHFNIYGFQLPKLIRRWKYILNMPENYTQSSYKLPTHFSPFEVVKKHCIGRAESVIYLHREPTPSSALPVSNWMHLREIWPGKVG